MCHLRYSKTISISMLSALLGLCNLSSILRCHYSIESLSHLHPSSFDQNGVECGKSSQDRTRQIVRVHQLNPYLCLHLMILQPQPNPPGFDVALHPIHHPQL